MKSKKIKFSELKHIIKDLIKENLKYNITENISLIDKILDKLNRDGEQNLSYDEKKYLKQYSEDNIDKELENWLLDSENENIQYDEFEYDEDVLQNKNKLKRIITKHLDKKPFSNNSDWGGGLVWGLKTINNLTGVFFYLGDNELVVLKRTINEDEEYEDEIIEYITNGKQLYLSLIKYK